MEILCYAVIPKRSSGIFALFIYKRYFEASSIASFTHNLTSISDNTSNQTSRDDAWTIYVVSTMGIMNTTVL